MDPVILILAGVAAFILFRLASVLGTRTGHEQHHDLEPVQRQPRKEGGASETVSLETSEKPAAPISTNARNLREADPSFDEAEFLAGARAAYEMIVEAFASGDIRSIRNYLSDTVYETFKGAVVARERAGHVSDLKFVGIDHAAIVDSGVADGAMSATTEFTSNQVRVTRDKEGNVVDGDANRIELVKDRWTFSRKFPGNDPNWVLPLARARAVYDLPHEALDCAIWSGTREHKATSFSPYPVYSFTTERRCGGGGCVWRRRVSPGAAKTGSIGIRPGAA